ncbi:MAG: hypothetical protein ACLFSY_08530 [Desulfonatronovibrionaceae bacterium]
MLLCRPRRSTSLLLLWLLFWAVVPVWGNEVVIPPEPGKAENLGSLVVLESIEEQQSELRGQLRQRREELEEAKSAESKNEILKDINEISSSIQELEKNFLHIAAGVDPKAVEGGEEPEFKWNQEVISLVRPLVQELKKLTAGPRKKERLQAEAEETRERLSVVNKALKNMSALMQETENPDLQKSLQSLHRKWEDRRKRLKNSLAVVSSQLDKLEQEKQSFIQSARQNVEGFFRNRGKNAFLAVLSFLAVFIGLRYVLRRLIRIMPGRRKGAEIRGFYARLGELIFHILTLTAAIGALMAVLFAVGDWVLLSLIIIFLLGLGWTAKQGLMRFWEQIKLFLNLGAVREGERLVYAGVPWKVSKLNFYTDLENPAFEKCRLRIPIKELLDRHSRPFAPTEPWFPCTKGDWILFEDDGERGRVISQTHEMVQLVKRGGSRQTYQTADFLGRAPVNLSTNFRLRVVFGIDYAHQAESTDRIPEMLHNLVQKGLEKEGYADDLLNLRVEFSSAGSSALNLIMIVDFHGRRAELYGRLNRCLQRLAVEACNTYNWGIPFTQITIHKANE